MRASIRLIRRFITASFQQEMAYRSNFFIGALHSMLNFATGLLGISIIFGQVETVNGYAFDSTLAVLGVYLTMSALRGLFISPSLDALAGMDGDIWQGRFDFTLLKPVDTQFLASFGRWRPFALFDLLLGIGVLAAAVSRLASTPTAADLLTFLIAMIAALLALYAILLFLAGLLFWSPGFLYTWIFDGIFQLGRYPVGLYPGALQLLLTWVVPIALITTIPAQALTSTLDPGRLLAALLFALVLTAAATATFRVGLRRYVSPSS